MKQPNEFNKHASALVTSANVLSRLKGRNLWCSPDSVALALATVDGMRASLSALRRAVEDASAGQQ